MVCTPFQIGNARGILCTRGPRPRCSCGKPATIQCDAPTPAKLISSGPNAGRVRKAGTCDKHLCAGCAVEVGADRHLCSGCAASGFAPADEAGEPVQAGLF